MKIEKYCFLFLLLSLFFSSCKEVSFKEPQPTGITSLKSIPENLRGWYQGGDNNTKEDTDTLIIESWGYHFKDKDDKDWLGKGTLSDSLVIKFYQDYYFVNFRSGNQWVLRLVRQKANGTIEFLSIDIEDDAKQKEMLRKMSKKFKVTEIKKESDTFYQIAPTKEQLMQLIQEGYFTGIELHKIK
jgi:hypothetical protein